MVCSCVLYYDETIIYYAKLFLPFSSELFLRTVVIITARLYPLYTVAQNGHYYNNENTQQTLFCRQFSFKFCAKHFLTKILHFIKNEHTLSRAEAR